MRYALFMLWMIFCSVPSSMAQVSIGIGFPGVNIGINLPLFPELVRVPNYPVYYAPGLNSNFFFYDGMYWVYEGDNWYASSWYNGPWGFVEPEVVPLFVLRIPVRYYRNPPSYFRGWQPDAPPRWGAHWGNDWERHRSGWDRWNRRSAPAPAPLPVYQRQYSGDRYPRAEQQHAIRSQNYRYQPRDNVVRQHFQQQAAPRASAPSERGQQGAGQVSSQGQQERQRSNAPAPQQQGGADVPRSQSQRSREDFQKPAPAQAAPQQRSPVVQERPPQPGAVQERRQQPRPGAAQREQQSARPGQVDTLQDRGTPQEPRRAQGQDRDKSEERGQDRRR